MRLVGERVVLRDLCGADVDPYVRSFLADPPLLEALGVDDSLTAKDVRSFLRRQPKLRESGERMQLALADPESDAFWGEIVLHHLSWPHRRGEVGFFVVREARRRGVGREAVMLLTEWAFEELGLHRMQLVTLPDNEATIGLALKAGYEREGILRGYTFERGEFKDNLVFSRLA